VPYARHHGPSGTDGAEIWLSPDRRVGLGHRRLSIIDLSTVANQPMPNEDESVWVTYNGEIYNHTGLRKELAAAGHRFRTDHSDTEVLVHGYEQWGIDGLAARIAGDYAFGIWDSRKQVLQLVRDRIGVKPLYFTVGAGFIAFASEIKALLRHPDVRAEVDPSAMYHYLSFLTTRRDDDVRRHQQVASGLSTHRAIGRVAESHRYWTRCPGRASRRASFAGLSESAVEDILRRWHSRPPQSNSRQANDVRRAFGVFLSGGIDSSTNVALMRAEWPPGRHVHCRFRDFTHLHELSTRR
jgi:asparagine synthase (glutamine-hydrolysing)